MIENFIFHRLSNYEHAKPEHFKYVRAVMSAASNLAETDVKRFKKMLVLNRAEIWFRHKQKSLIFHCLL